MLNHLRERVTKTLASVRSVTMATYGPAAIQAGVFSCQAIEMRIYLLVPRTSDHLFNLEHNPEVVLTTEGWQLRGTASVDHECPAGLSLLTLPEAAWCEVVRVCPMRLQIERPGEPVHAETIDIG